MNSAREFASKFHLYVENLATNEAHFEHLIDNWCR